MYGGFTEGRKLAALCELNHVQVAPHHDCFIHAQLVASTPAGLIVEAFTDPERDPLQAELYEDAPEIKDGMIKLPSLPGLGLTLNEKAIEKYGTRILWDIDWTQRNITEYSHGLFHLRFHYSLAGVELFFGI